MKTDLYLKIVLTIIAACLVALTFQQFRFLPVAVAATPVPSVITIPARPDGTVEVVIKGFDEDLNINLDKVGGYGAYNGIPVVVKNN